MKQQLPPASSKKPHENNNNNSSSSAKPILNPQRKHLATINSNLLRLKNSNDQSTIESSSHGKDLRQSSSVNKPAGSLFQPDERFKILNYQIYTEPDKIINLSELQTIKGTPSRCNGYPILTSGSQTPKILVQSTLKRSNNSNKENIKNDDFLLPACTKQSFFNRTRNSSIAEKEKAANVSGNHKSIPLLNDANEEKKMLQVLIQQQQQHHQKPTSSSSSRFHKKSSQPQLTLPSQQQQQQQPSQPFLIRPQRVHRSSMGKYSIEVAAETQQLEKRYRSFTHSTLSAASNRYSSFRQNTCPSEKPPQQNQKTTTKTNLLNVSTSNNNNGGNQHPNGAINCGMRITKSSDLKSISILEAYDKSGISSNTAIDKKTFKSFLKELKLKSGHEEQLMIKYMFDYFQAWQRKILLSFTSLQKQVFSLNPIKENDAKDFEKTIKKKTARTKKIRKYIGVILAQVKQGKDIKRLAQISEMTEHYETIFKNIVDICISRMKVENYLKKAQLNEKINVMVNYQEIQENIQNNSSSNCQSYNCNKDTIQSKMLQGVVESLKVPMENLTKSAKKNTHVFYEACEIIIQTFEDTVKEAISSEASIFKLGILGQCGRELANFVEKSVKLNEDIATVMEGLPLQPDRDVQLTYEKQKEQCKEYAQEMFQVFESEIHLNSAANQFDKVFMMLANLKENAQVYVSECSNQKSEEIKEKAKQYECSVIEISENLLKLQELAVLIQGKVDEKVKLFANSASFAMIKDVRERCVQFKAIYNETINLFKRLISPDDAESQNLLFEDDPTPKRNKSRKRKRAFSQNKQYYSEPVQQQPQKLQQCFKGQSKGDVLVDKQCEEIEDLFEINHYFQSNVNQVESLAIFSEPGKILKDYPMNEEGRKAFLRDISVGVERLMELRENTEEAIDISSSHNLSNVIKSIQLGSQKYGQIADIALAAAQICNLSKIEVDNTINGQSKNQEGSKLSNNLGNLQTTSNNILKEQLPLDQAAQKENGSEQQQAQKQIENEIIESNVANKKEKDVVQILMQLKRMRVRKEETLKKNEWFEKFTKYFLNGLLLFDYHLTQFPALLSELRLLINHHNSTIVSFDTISNHIQHLLSALKTNGYLCEKIVQPHILNSLNALQQRAQFAVKLFGTQHAILPNAQLLSRIAELQFETLLHSKPYDKIIEQFEKLSIFLLKGAEIIKAEMMVLEQIKPFQEIAARKEQPSDEPQEGQADQLQPKKQVLREISLTFGMSSDSQQKQLSSSYQKIISEALTFGNLLSAFATESRKNKDVFGLGMYEQFLRASVQYLQVKRDKVSVFMNKEGEVRHIQAASGDEEYSVFQEKIAFIQKHVVPAHKNGAKELIVEYAKQIEQIFYKSGPIMFKYHFKQFRSQIDFQIDSPCPNLMLVVSLESDPSSVILTRTLQNQRISATLPINDIYARLSITLVAREQKQGQQLQEQQEKQIQQQFQSISPTNSLSCEQSQSFSGKFVFPSEGFLRHKSTHGFLVRAQRTTSLKISNLNYNLKNEETFKIFFHLKKSNLPGNTQQSLEGLKLKKPAEVSAVIDSNRIYDGSVETETDLVIQQQIFENNPLIQEWTILGSQNTSNSDTNSLQPPQAIDFYVKMNSTDEGIFYIFDKENSYTISSSFLQKRKETFEKSKASNFSTESTNKETINNSHTLSNQQGIQLWHAFTITNCNKLLDQSKLVDNDFLINLQP